MKAKYQRSLDFLFSQLPMFQRVGPKAFKKDLNNIRALAEHLGHPEKDFPSIHIAGTNGKGSTAHMLSAILQARGFKTGLYTSPHYRDFRERIKVNGQLIPEKEIVQFVEKYKDFFIILKPSFFEISVAMAFSFFAKKKVDIGIVETGLGGRLDSTNILTPLLSVITNISYDHSNFLGETLAEIATEKAGIIKERVPVVIGETHPETKPVFSDKAKEKNTCLFFADEHFEAVPIEKNTTHRFYKILKNKEVFLEKMSLNLHGDFQSKNLVTAIQAMEILDKNHPAFESEKEESRWIGLKNLKSLTNFVGRWHIIGEKPDILCDSAHNAAGISLIIKELSSLDFENLHMVLGTVFDKPLGKILSLFPKQAIYYFAKPDIPRGLDARILKEKAAEFGLFGKAFNSVQSALSSAKSSAKERDLIFVGGSSFVVAEVVPPHPLTP